MCVSPAPSCSELRPPSPSSSPRCEWLDWQCWHGCTGEVGSGPRYCGRGGGTALQHTGVEGKGGIALHPLTLQDASEAPHSWSNLGKGSRCWRRPPLSPLWHRGAPGCRDVLLQQGAAAGTGAPAAQEGKGGDLSSPQCTHRRQHSCCGTFRKGPGGKETERVVLQVPGFSVVHGPFQPCQCAAHRQSPFLRRGRQSCLRGVAGGEGDRQQHCTLDQHLLDQLLQLHAPPPSPCCGSFGEEKPLAVPCPPGKPLAKNASSMSLSALAL